jgi:hypothetical protein
LAFTAQCSFSTAQKHNVKAVYWVSRRLGLQRVVREGSDDGRESFAARREDLRDAAARARQFHSTFLATVKDAGSGVCPGAGVGPVGRPETGPGPGVHGDDWAAKVFGFLGLSGLPALRGSVKLLLAVVCELSATAAGGGVSQDVWEKTACVLDSLLESAMELEPSHDSYEDRLCATGLACLKFAVVSEWAASRCRMHPVGIMPWSLFVDWVHAQLVSCQLTSRLQFFDGVCMWVDEVSEVLLHCFQKAYDSFLGPVCLHHEEILTTTCSVNTIRLVAEVASAGIRRGMCCTPFQVKVQAQRPDFWSGSVVDRVVPWLTPDVEDAFVVCKCMARPVTECARESKGMRLQTVLTTLLTVVDLHENKCMIRRIEPEDVAVFLFHGCFRTCPSTAGALARLLTRPAKFGHYPSDAFIPRDLADHIHLWMMQANGQPPACFGSPFRLWTACTELLCGEYQTGAGLATGSSLVPLKPPPPTLDRIWENLLDAFETHLRSAMSNCDDEDLETDPSQKHHGDMSHKAVSLFVLDLQRIPQCARIVAVYQAWLDAKNQALTPAVVKVRNAP